MNTDLRRLWADTLTLVKDEVTRIGYDTWFVPLRPRALNHNILILEAPSALVRNLIQERYLPLLSRALRECAGRDTQLELLLPGEKSAHEEETSPGPSNALSGNAIHLNPRYTFDTFVVGESNRFAHAASLAVAETPASHYNPLFIYGGVGLGKTHLMHAIGNYIVSQNSAAKVLYITSETFTNELIASIRSNRSAAAESNDEFRNHYRNVDVLLIDDIQFIAGKDATQQEFFHTFNALHDANKQIVISSDKPPKEIATLEERLRSRFEWGLIADIQTPDVETRAAILRKKAEMEHLNIEDDVLLYIAERLQSNIRELESSLKTVVFYSNVSHRRITTALVDEALKDFFLKKARSITPELVQETVSHYFQLQKEDMVSQRRTRTIAFPRQIAMYLCREMTGMSLQKVGEAFGGRDYSTVIHACEKIGEEIKTNDSTARTVDELKRRISEST